MFGEQEDFEEQYVFPPLKTLQFTMNPPIKIESTALHVAFYGVSSLYASSLIDTQNVVARINFQKSKQKSLASVYFNEQKKQAFIIFNQEFEKMRQIHFAQFIQKNFSFKQLFIFTSVAKGILQKDDGVKLMYLQTSYGLDLHGPHFTQGISGAQADLMQWAQVNGIHAICFVGIYSDYEVNRSIVDEIFGKLAQIFPFQSKFDISKPIKNYNTFKFSNKLYL